MALIGPGYVKPSPFAKLGQVPAPKTPWQSVDTFGQQPGVTPPPPPPGSPYDYGANNYGPNGPAYTPPPVDYNALIQSMLAPLQHEAAGMTAADKAALLAQQRRAVIQFGEPISGTDVGSGALASATQNTQAGLSITARVNQAHQDAVRQLQNTLAARGLLRSGETGFQTGREQTAYTQAQYDSRQKVLDYLAGIQSAYQQAQQQRQWALAQAAMSAAQSVPQYPTPVPYAGSGYDYGANNYGPNGPPVFSVPTTTGAGGATFAGRTFMPGA